MENFELSWDIIVIAVVVIATFVWFYTRGKDFIVTIILGAYVSGVAMMFAPILANLNINVGIPEYQAKVIIFLLLTVFFSWIMGTNGFFEPYIVPDGWEIGVFAFLFSGLFLAMSATFVPVEAMEEMSNITKLIFGHEALQTAWILAPIGVLLFIRGES